MVAVFRCQVCGESIYAQSQSISFVLNNGQGGAYCPEHAPSIDELAGEDE